MSAENLSVGEFGVAFKGFLEQAVAQAPAPEPFFRARLTEHLGASPAGLPIVAEQFAGHEHPNLQVALDDYMASGARQVELLGVASDYKRMMGLGLSDLTAQSKPGLVGGGAPSEGPVDYVNLPSGLDEKLACVQFGLYLISGADGPLAVLVRGADQRNFGQIGVTLEVLAPDRAAAERFYADIRQRMRQRNIYRGRIVSLSADKQGRLQVTFHRLPPVDRDGIILPAGVLERIERQTIQFARLRDRLTAAGRHMKRGMLLWGPPGTGKTLTAMYLARQMPDRTVLLLTGSTLGLIETSCTMARLLQPSTVILEDVDLVAEERTHQSTSANAVLFELLNQMDGLSDDADVLFILTTNRPELLEPALASRPGRIDQAVEVPLPDVLCRSRLIDLYGRGLSLQLPDRTRVIDRMEGVSASFVKELLRKAAVFAAEASPDAPADEQLVVTEDHLDQALFDLLTGGGDLTRVLLGGAGVPGARKPSCG